MGQRLGSGPAVPATQEAKLPAQTEVSPPETKTMRLEVEGDIGILTLDRPDSLNAMSPDLIGELTVVAPWLADRAPLRALIVTGEGRAFCSGGDVTWFKKGVDAGDEFDLPSDVRHGADVLHQAIIDFRRIPYPVIAAVNGVAAGAGFSLALMCDMRLASSEAAFVCAYGRIGASPDGGMTYFLPRIVGPARAIELLINDPLLSAEAAKDMGIVAEVVEPDELLTRAREKAEKLARKAPHYIRMCKLLVSQSLDNSLADHLQLERHGIADSMGTEDLAEGVTAFFEKREAQFTGR
jgi:enoyl-CoA hydratase/carnithine racemase